jgi:hypothetical protein
MPKWPFVQNLDQQFGQPKGRKKSRKIRTVISNRSVLDLGVAKPGTEGTITNCPMQLRENEAAASIFTWGPDQPRVSNAQHRQIRLIP